MREILFRGKRMCNNKWMFGSLLCYLDGDRYICCDNYNGGHNHYKIDPETTGQFTGLLDKNGLEIYEGDILEYTSHTDTGIKEINRAVVFWDEHRWSYEIIYSNRWTENWNNKGRKCDIYKEIVAKYGEVIGNIHDNPELLV